MENLDKLQELGIVKVNDDKSIELTELGIFLVYIEGILIFRWVHAMFEKWGFNKDKKLEKELKVKK